VADLHYRDHRTTALMLITPDAVHRGLATEVVRRIRLAGFRIAGHRLWQTAPRDLDGFHRRNGPVDRDPRLYRLVEELFAFGPLLALAVREGAGRPPEQVHQRLSLVKGRGDPACAAPGSIRKDLRSINTILNIVHSSDDAEDTAREAGWFLEAGEGPLETGPVELYRCLRDLEHGGPADNRPFEEILGGVRARVLAALWPRLAPDRRAAAGGHRTPADLHDFGGPAGAACLDEVLPACHGLGGLVHPPFPGADPATAPPVEVARLADLGVTLDPWEHLVLATSRYYPPLPSAAPAPPGPLPRPAVSVGPSADLQGQNR
jgi:nucleoside diphosphate kinase